MCQCSVSVNIVGAAHMPEARHPCTAEDRTADSRVVELRNNGRRFKTNGASAFESR